MKHTSSKTGYFQNRMCVFLLFVSLFQFFLLNFFIFFFRRTLSKLQNCEVMITVFGWRCIEASQSSNCWVPATSGKKEGGCGDKRGWYGFCARSGEANVKANESACFDVLDFEYFECLFLGCGYLVDVMGAKMAMGVVMGMVLEAAETVFSDGLEVVSGVWVVFVLLSSFVRRCGRCWCG